MGHDPILVEVIRNELESLVDEMRIATRKTGRSPMVKIGDFSTVLCDRNGRGLGVGRTHSPIVESLHGLAATVLHRYGEKLRPGDVFMCNDPYGGGSHIPDLILISPLFWRGRRVAFVSIYSHHSDMGGRFAGSQSGACTETYEEGLRIPLLQYADAGVTRAELLELLLANVRTRDDFTGDVDAKIAGIWRAGKNLTALLDRYGLDAFDDCCNYLIETGEARVREAIAELPPGEYTHEAWLGDDGLGPCDPPLRIKVTLRPQGDRISVDFTGTDPQARGGVNMPVENTRGIVLTILREILHPSVTMNEGTRRPIEIITPPGTLVNPTFPAATTGRAPLFFLVDEAIQRAMAQAIPDRVAVPREGMDLVHFSRRGADGKETALLDLIAGGWGGRPRSDGPDGISGTSMSAIPAEVIEREFPILIEGCGLLADSAGPGRYRGSMAVYRKYRFLEPGRVMIRTNRLEPSTGLLGGLPGIASNSVVEQGATLRELPQRAYIHFEAGAGDALVHRVGGTGGHGDPKARDPDKVRTDVRQERLSPSQASEQYGVAIAPTGPAPSFRSGSGHHG